MNGVKFLSIDSVSCICKDTEEKLNGCQYEVFAQLNISSQKKQKLAMHCR